MLIQDDTEHSNLILDGSMRILCAMRVCTTRKTKACLNLAITVLLNYMYGYVYIYVPPNFNFDPEHAELICNWILQCVTI